MTQDKKALSGIKPYKTPVMAIDEGRERVNKVVKLCCQIDTLYKNLKWLEHEMTSQELTEYRKRTT